MARHRDRRHGRFLPRPAILCPDGAPSRPLLRRAHRRQVPLDPGEAARLRAQHECRGPGLYASADPVQYGDGGWRDCELRLAEEESEELGYVCL